MEGTVGDDFRGDIAIDDLSFIGCQPYNGEVKIYGISFLKKYPFLLGLESIWIQFPISGCKKSGF